MTTKKEKVILIRNVSQEKFGGSETYQISIAKQLLHNNFLPIIATNSKKLKENAEQNGIKIIEPPYIKRQNWSGLANFLLPIYLLKISKQYHWYLNYFKVEKPSVINVQSRDDWISATLAAKKLKITTLWTDHADFRNWALWNINKKFKNPIGKAIVRLSKYPTNIILISNYEKAWLKQTLGKKYFKNCTVIRNAIEDHFSSKNKNDNQNIIFLGRIVKEKGIYELLDAYDKIAKKFPKSKLYIYGEGDDLSKRKESQNPQIKVMGITTNQFEALNNASIFVQSSQNEGLSISLLEALMMQKTIIATNVGATNEAIIDGKNGILISPNNQIQLQEAITTLLRDEKLRQNLATEARKTYLNSFNLDAIFKQKMLPLYKKENS